MRPLARWVGVGMAVLLVLAPPAACAAWRRNAQGACVRVWTPGSLARGPIAILGAPLAPIRTSVGAVQWANRDKAPRDLFRKVIIYPFVAVAGFVVGFIDTGWWIGTGLADMVTGGVFMVAPDDATELSVAPLAPTFLASVPPAPPDRCAKQ